MSSLPAIAVYVVGVIGLAVVTWFYGVLGYRGGLVTGGAIALMGFGSLAFLAYNRSKGLHHSATGIAHHDIDSRERVDVESLGSRERVAMHTIDKHVEVLKMLHRGEKE